MIKLTSVFKSPEGSITVGLAQAAAVYAIYTAALPTQTDIRSADAHNVDVEAARKRAAWQAAALLGLVFLITKDLNSFLIGGAALGGIDLVTKHADAVNPATGRMSDSVGAVDNDVAFPMPDYADTQPADDGGY